MVSLPFLLYSKAALGATSSSYISKTPPRENGTILDSAPPSPLSLPPLPLLILGLSGPGV